MAVAAPQASDYEVLGLSPDEAGEEEIRVAYKKLVSLVRVCCLSKLRMSDK